MNIKKIAVMVSKYFFLALFLCLLVAVLRGAQFLRHGT